VRAGAAEVLSWTDVPTVDILVNSAGVMLVPERTLTEDGVEMHLATNHIGHFLLFQLLTPVLLASTPSRVVVVSSDAHTFAQRRIDYSRLPSVPEAQYSGFGAYQQSKVANILFALEIHRRYSSQGLTAYSLNPGGIKTGLQDEATQWWLHAIMWVFAWAMKSIPQGAATSVYCAVAPGLEAVSGEYFNNSHVTEGVKNMKLPEDETTKLWEWTEKFIAEH